MIMVEEFYLEVKRVLEELVGNIISNIVEHHFDYSAYYLLSRALTSPLVMPGQRHNEIFSLLQRVSLERSIDLRQAAPLPEIFYNTKVGLSDFINVLSMELLDTIELCFVVAICEKAEDPEFWALLDHLIRSCGLQGVISHYLVHDCFIPSHPDLFGLSY